MALRDPLPMGLGRGGFNPMQVNQVFNECLVKEHRFQGPVSRRPFRLNLPKLKQEQVQPNVNPRSKVAIREALSKGANSPRMMTDLQKVLRGELTQAKEAVGTSPERSPSSKLVAKSVMEHLETGAAPCGEEKASMRGGTALRKTLALQQMPPAERHRLPETMSQEVGWLVCSSNCQPHPRRSLSVPQLGGGPTAASEDNGEAPRQAYRKPSFWWKPRRPCPETEYVRLYYETLQSNPFSNAGMFPDASEKK